MSENVNGNIYMIQLEIPSSLRLMGTDDRDKTIRNIAAYSSESITSKHDVQKVTLSFEYIDDDTATLTLMGVKTKTVTFFEIIKFVRSCWDYYCRIALTDLMKSHPYNPVIKEDINRIDAFAISQQASEYSDKDDYDKAIELLHTAISLCPSVSMLYNDLGVALSMKGDINNGIENLKHAVRIDPSNEKAFRNLPGAIGNLNPLIEGKLEFPCLFPECDATISVTIPAGDQFIVKCSRCNAVELQFKNNQFEKANIYKYILTPNFPQVCSFQDLLSSVSGIWLLEEANVILKPYREPEFIKNHDGIFEVELYEIEGICIIRLVYLIQDHPVNPSIMNCVYDGRSPRNLGEVRYLKVVQSVKLHVYDLQNKFCFTKEIPVANIAPKSSGGPYAYGKLKRVQLACETWSTYIDAIVEKARSSLAFLDGDPSRFKQACASMKKYPLTCLCEICGKESLTTASQCNEEDGPFDVGKLKSSDAIQCVRCNVVLCVECSAKYIKIDSQGKVITPISCSVCGQPFSIY